jgi:uncharacterized membrane protein HdeD (DUF308 family)
MISIGDKYMSWIKDVKTELNNLDTSPKRLKSFGIIVGGIFLAIGIWIFFKSESTFAYLLGFLGIFLILGGLLFPRNLIGIYKIWMGTAFALGWIVSRTILVLLFYLIVTPIGFIAKLFNKHFMDVNFENKDKSYWIAKSSVHKIDYEKMY